MSSTIEAIMRYMATTPNPPPHQTNETEKLEKEVIAKERQVYLAGSEIRANDGTVSLRRARRLSQQRSGRQKCPGANDPRFARRVKGADLC